MPAQTVADTRVNAPGYSAPQPDITVRPARVRRPSSLAPHKKAGAATKRVPAKFTMADLTFETCRWPSGDPQHTDFQFCGGTAERGKPYCTPHCSLAYTPSKPRKAP